MNDEGVCRTAPATPGLLNRLQDTFFFYFVELFSSELKIPVFCISVII